MEGHVRVGAGLVAVGAELFGGVGGFPGGGGLRRCPAQGADGRGGVGDAFEGTDLGICGEGAGDGAFISLQGEGGL